MDDATMAGGGGGSVGRIRINAETSVLLGLLSPAPATGLSTVGTLLGSTTLVEIDAGVPDAGVDAGVDAGEPDAGIDAGELDAGIEPADAGVPVAHAYTVGCACDGTGGAWLAAWLLLGALARRSPRS
jgi:hypothetical protein